MATIALLKYPIRILLPNLLAFVGLISHVAPRLLGQPAGVARSVPALGALPLATDSPETLRLGAREVQIHLYAKDVNQKRQNQRRQQCDLHTSANFMKGWDALLVRHGVPVGQHGNDSIRALGALRMK